MTFFYVYSLKVLKPNKRRRVDAFYREGYCYLFNTWALYKRALVDIFDGRSYHCGVTAAYQRVTFGLNNCVAVVAAVVDGVLLVYSDAVE